MWRSEGRHGGPEEFIRVQPASASTDANLSIGFRVRGGGGTSSFWGFWCSGILGGWGKGETKELVEDRLREGPLC